MQNTVTARKILPEGRKGDIRERKDKVEGKKRLQRSEERV